MYEWVQVKRTKEILSANSEAPISIEELHSGIDFRSRITRWERWDLLRKQPLQMHFYKPSACMVLSIQSLILY